MSGWREKREIILLFILRDRDAWEAEEYLSFLFLCEHYSFSIKRVLRKAAKELCKSLAEKSQRCCWKYFRSGGVCQHCPSDLGADLSLGIQRRVSYKSLGSEDNHLVFHEVKEGKPKETFRERYNILQITGRECDLCLFALIWVRQVCSVKARKRMLLLMKEKTYICPGSCFGGSENGSVIHALAIASSKSPWDLHKAQMWGLRKSEWEIVHRL